MYPTIPPNLRFATLAIAVNAALFTSLTVHAADEELPSTTLPVITVIAETKAETADGPVQGIAASTVSSTTGIDESILKSTQSVTVVGQQEIETIGANDIIRALDYSAGINNDATDKTTESYVVRGFRNLVAYRDGKRLQNNIFDGQQEIYGVERIEAVRGPNSLLNGSLPPGGVINAISKKPYFTNGYEVNAELGSFNHHQISTDINQKVNNDIAVRLVGVYRDSDTFVDFVPNDRTYIAPSLTWQPNDETSLTLQADYQHDLSAYVSGLPFEGTLHPNANGEKIVRSFNQGIEDFDRYDNKRYTLGYQLSHQVNPNLQIKHNLRYMNVDGYFDYTSDDGLANDSVTTYTRSVQKRENKSKQLTTSVSAIYDWDINDNIHNVTLFGIDYGKQDYSTERSDGSASNIDFFYPDHSQDSIGNTFTPNPYSGTDKAKQIGVFIQNQATVNDQWVGVVGLRRDEVTAEQQSSVIKFLRQEADTSATTGRVGLVYLMDNGIAPYASINQSFEPNLGVDQEGKLLDPTKGTQYEVGVRYHPNGSDTLLTGSVYRIDQTDVVAAAPQSPLVQIQLGEVRSQGIELEAKTAINDNVNLIAAYAYTDARTIKSAPTTPELEGKRTTSVPYNKFSLWSDYRFADFGLPQLKIGTGLRYTGETLDSDNTHEVPSYTLIDAMVSYDWSENLKLSMNVNNVLDKEYVTCSYDCYYGEPRNVVGKVTYKW